MEHKVLKVILAHKALKELPATLVPKALKVVWEHKELKV